MAMDLARMLDRIQSRQWALADIDWDAPGAELITEEQRPQLAKFMADVAWIEQVGARAFAALAAKADDPDLAEIYRYFHAEEQRHANVELALMRRWDMLDGDEPPEPSISIRLAMDWLERYADHLPLAVLATAIPMLEVALDGALLKFLTDEVPDPLCQEVFELVNNDESRHLAVGFHVLEVLGRDPSYLHAARLAKVLLSPAAVAVLPAAIPLFANARTSIIDLGLDETKLYTAMARFDQVGRRSPIVKRNPAYLALKEFGKIVADGSHPYHVLSNGVTRAMAHYPRWLLADPPAWTSELTARAVV